MNEGDSSGPADGLGVGYEGKKPLGMVPTFQPEQRGECGVNSQDDCVLRNRLEVSFGPGD